jgi:RNA polymerase sigma-70 factor, ECF subfamily
MPNRKKLQQSGTDGGINPESLARNDGAGRLRKVIQKLPPQYRIVLVLRDMEEFSDEQVAAITGLRSGTMRVRLHRARLLLRNELMKGVKSRGGKAAAVSGASAPAQPRREPPTPALCKATFAELSDYLDGQLDGSLSKKLKQHLKDCLSCRVSLATLKATVEQCRKSPPEKLNRERTARLGAKVLTDYERTVAKKARP